MEHTLYTLCNVMNCINEIPESARADRYMDVLLSLVYMIEGGEIHSQLAPGTIIVSEDSVRLKENDRDITHYSAPEVIFEGHENDKEAQLFSLGLVIFYMLYSVDYYTAAGLRLLEIEQIKKMQPEYLIDLQEAENPRVPIKYYEQLREVMKYLTSWKPEKRYMGEKLLIEMYNWIVSKNSVYYMDGNKQIGPPMKVEILNDVKGYPKDINELVLGKNEYRIIERIDIPYRPGIHRYNIQVRRV